MTGAPKKKTGWICVGTSAGAHCYPEEDAKPHDIESLDCPCDPRIDWIDDDTGLPYPNGPCVWHNAFDEMETPP